MRTVGHWQRAVLDHLRAVEAAGPPKKNTLGDLLAVGGAKYEKKHRESRLMSLFGLQERGYIEEFQSEIEPEPKQMRFRLTGLGTVETIDGNVSERLFD